MPSDAFAQPTPNLSERVNDILEERERLIREGATPDLSGLCGADSSLRDEVEAVISRLDSVATVLDAPLRTAEAPQFVALGLRLRILRPLASGGQGSVYLAYDETLKREVAVKTPHWREPGSALRLRKEAEIASRLDHPGIVPIFGAGVTEIGLPFLVMRYVRGVTLESALRDADGFASNDACETSVRAALRALSAASRTVAYAHGRGVLHADLKPSNILLGACGETALLDWGAAIPFKVDDMPKEALEISQGSALRDQAYAFGTEEFMSPERLARSGELGPWTDIYSLGATVDRIMRGPAIGRSGAAVPTGAAGADRDGADRRQPSLLPAVRTQLRGLADWACATDPSARPNSADKVADAIDSLLNAKTLIGVPRPGFFSRLFRRNEA